MKQEEKRIYIEQMADLCGRAAIESMKLATAKHERKSPEELHKIEENLCKLITEGKEIEKMLEKYDEQKEGGSLD